MQLQNGYYPDHSQGAYQKKLRQRYQLKRLLARIFIEHDYGFKTFKAELAKSKLKIPINPSLYKHLCQAMVYKVVRAAQTMLIVHNNPALPRLNLRTIKYSYFLIENCRKFFSEEDTKTIFKMCKQQYRLGPETITLEEVQHFYQQLVDLIQNRAGRYHQTSSETIINDMAKEEDKKKISYLTSIWNQEYEYFLMQTYVQHQNFSKMRIEFQKRFNDEALAFTSQSLCHQFYLIMKKIIRKIEKSCLRIDDPSFPQLIKLRGKTIRRLVNPEEAEDIRNLVVKLYHKSSVNQEELREAVNTINQYFQHKQKAIQSTGNAKKLLIMQKLSTTSVKIDQRASSLLTNRIFVDRQDLNILNTLLETDLYQSSDFSNADSFSESDRTGSVLSQPDSIFSSFSYLPVLQNHFNLEESEIESLSGIEPFLKEEDLVEDQNK